MSWASELNAMERQAEEDRRWLDAKEREDDERDLVCVIAVFILVTTMLFMGLIVMFP